MGTKATEAATGCFAKAMPDEPMMVFLARDKQVPNLIRKWADDRERNSDNPDPIWNEATRTWDQPPHPDAAQIAEARYTAAKMEVWRYENDGKWREAE